MLSLSMIVRDEEARLGECLRSVQGLADEMVVVDTGLLLLIIWLKNMVCVMLPFLKKGV